MARPQKRRKRKATKAWLASPAGHEWLEKKITEKHARRPDPGPAPERLTRTKFPFEATINGHPFLVTRKLSGLRSASRVTLSRS